MSIKQGVSFQRNKWFNIELVLKQQLSRQNPYMITTIFEPLTPAYLGIS